MISLSSILVSLPCSTLPSFLVPDANGSRANSIAPARLQLLGLLLLCVALAPTVSAQQFTFRHYGQNEGLRNLDVFSMVEEPGGQTVAQTGSRSGALLMATENGVFRYDGSGFQQIGTAQGLREQLVLGLYKDAYDRVWVTTHDHIYELKDQHATAIPLSETDSHFNTGQNIATLDRMHLVVLTRGSLRLLTRTGVETNTWTVAPFFDDSQLKGHPELAHVHSIFLSRTGDLWLGCGTSICRVAHAAAAPSTQLRDVETFPPTRGVPAEVWRVFFEDREGNLWSRSERSILVFSDGAARFHNRDITGGLTPYSGSGLLAFAEDTQGNVLTQTNHGIARWEHDRWRVFDAANGIIVKDISTILIDRTGHPWFSTRGHGIYRWLGYGVIENWTTAQGLGDDVAWPVFRDSRRRLWISDQFQVGLLDEKTHHVASPAAFAKAPFPHATGFAEAPGGSLWFFGINGTVQRTDPEVKRITFRAQLPILSRNFTDSQGRLWIMSRDGLFVVRNFSTAGTPKIEPVTGSLLSGDAFADAAETPDHDLWFLSDSHLYRLSHQDGSYSRIPLDAGDTRGQMRNLAAAPDGSLWIGGGIPALLHLRVEGDRPRILERLTGSTLASTVVQIVRFDAFGRLWIGTDLGVNVFDGNNWTLITERDGLASNDTDEGAFFAEKDGSAWIGVNGGSVHILHPELFFASPPQDVRVTSAMLGGKPLSLVSNTANRWQNDSLDTTFTSLNLTRDASLRFRYRLTGLESRWNETSSHVLHYAAVPPGNYRFELQAIDPDRHRQSAITTFTFTIRPPWWRSQPFYVLLCLLSLLASILMWHWRERMLIRRQRILRQLVQQRTRELEAEKVELVAAREALRQQATRDALTGLWNRPAILDILRREMDRAHLAGTTLAVVLGDIDHFKQINDTLGHLAGDAILRDAAARMFQNLRPYDFIGRYGGEEFLVVLPGLPYEDPHARLGQLQQSIAGSVFYFEGHQVRVTSSFGAAWLDPTIASVEDFVRRADEALYKAKAQGRDRLVFYDEDQLNGNITDQLTT